MIAREVHERELRDWVDRVGGGFGCGAKNMASVHLHIRALR